MAAGTPLEQVPSRDLTPDQLQRREIAFDAALRLRFESLHAYDVHKAKKEHKCNGTRCDHQPIEPGTFYVRVVWGAPWFTMMEDEGVYEKLGSWVVSKYHPECLPKPMYWDGD